MLVEFALVSLSLYLIFAAMISFGRWMFLVQSAQDAARFAAREIALYPLPANATFAQALADPGFSEAVYSQDFLVVDLEAFPPGPALESVFANMPVVNRALRPLMITSTVDIGGANRQLLHMPGAIVDTGSGLTVLVPRIDARNQITGAEAAITFVPVLQELPPGSFSIASPERGLVAVRLNVPYQSATFSAYIPADELTPINNPIPATDLGGGGLPIVGPGPDGTGPYSGTYGLGEHFALGSRVRPFRRLIAAQALFRREVFQ